MMAASPRLSAAMSSLAPKLFPFLSWCDRITRLTLRADLMAGLVGALLVLPQAVAFATLAGLPPEYGLYGAMLPAVVGALWGSSSHLVSGPTNATSLMVFAMLGALATPFSQDYIRLVLTLNLMIGLIKLGLGVARLGALVNFISTTVILGFTAGAGLLIIAAQLRNFFGLAVAQEPSFAEAIATFFTHLGDIDGWAAAVGTVTLVAALLAKRLVPRIPYMLAAMIVGSAFAYALARAGVAQVATIGALPSAIPGLSLPDFSAGTWRMLAPAALALTLIGLTEAVSSARAVAARSGQRIDGIVRAHVELEGLRSFDVLNLLLVDVGRDHLRALAHEGLRDGAADSLSGRGDERDLALQTSGHGLLPSRGMLGQHDTRRVGSHPRGGDQ